MTSLKWRNADDRPSAKKSAASASNPPAASTSNPWFGLAMGLIGLIAGYIIHLSLS